MSRSAFAATLWSLVLAAASSAAATFTVSNANEKGHGSLAQALTDANASPGHDQIVFRIPGSGVRKIDISHTGLPEITDPVTIDGYTQPGAKPNSVSVGNNAVILIQLDAGGSQSAIIDALVISAGRCVVRGLSITGVRARVPVGIPEDPPPTTPPAGDVIVLKNGGGNVIAGNFIGVPPSGHADVFNYSYVGVHVLSGANRIGGTSPADRNLISQHYTGVELAGAGAILQGNYIGTDASGTTKSGGNYGGNGVGVSVSAPDVRIGGTKFGAGNLIAGNQIEVFLASTRAVVQGNRIGPGVNGSVPLERISRGVEISGSGNLVGGLAAGAGNAITRWVRITREKATGNAVLSNIFFYSGVLFGVNGTDTRNDLGDADTGPNQLQNFPVLTRVTSAGGYIFIEGGLNSAPSTSFTVQFYRYRGISPLELLGTRSIRTDGAGQASFSFKLAGEVEAEDFITAAATDSGGNTSEFAPLNGRVQVANISTRGKVGTDDHILIGGFVLHRPQGYDGDFTKRVLIRALGPSLSLRGGTTGDLLADPMLELYGNDGKLIARNDNWRSSQPAAIAATGAPPADDREAATIATLREGAYTVQVRGVNGAAGTGIVEAYDLDPLDPKDSLGSGRLVNISTRGNVGTGDNVLIGGFIVNGDAAQPVILRAIGPGLRSRGVADPLDDPTLELRDASGSLLAANDDWRDEQATEISATPFAPADEREAAIKATLIPGNYTAIVRGKGGATGLALVELYDLTH